MFSLFPGQLPLSSDELINSPRQVSATPGQDIQGGDPGGGNEITKVLRQEACALGTILPIPPLPFTALLHRMEKGSGCPVWPEPTDTAAERNNQCGIDVDVGRFECKTEARTGRV